MVAMNRVRVAWTGFTGAPGVSTFYFGSTTTDMAALKTFFTSLGPYLPNSVNIAVPAIGDQINDTDGAITGSWSGLNGGSVVGTGGSTGYSGASGFAVNWKSTLIVAGRRVQGRTFFVPSAVIAYQSDGTIVESLRTTITTAANTLVTAYAGEFKVWSRPFAGRAAVGTPGTPGYRPAKPARVGVAAQVLAAAVPDLAVVRRSRRT